MIAVMIAIFDRIRKVPQNGGLAPAASKKRGEQGFCMHRSLLGGVPVGRGWVTQNSEQTRSRQQRHTVEFDPI
jgi:hypothetical protein